MKYEAMRVKVAEEIVSANELLGIWPEDLKVDIRIGAWPKPPSFYAHERKDRPKS